MGEELLWYGTTCSETEQEIWLQFEWSLNAHRKCQYISWQFDTKGFEIRTKQWFSVVLR